MRIAFLGKGGSGKTSIATATIVALQEQFKNILAIDADLNAHLGKYLGLPHPEHPLGDNFDSVAQYLFGSRTIATYPKIGTIPPTKDSQFIRIAATDPFLTQYAVQKKNLYHLSSGTYNTKDLGDSCFHAKLNSLELALHHLLDTSEDLVVIDAAAGVDSVATSMHFAADIAFFVIEPTEKSISVYQDYVAILHKKHLKYPSTIIPVFNKIEDANDLAYISKVIPLPKDPLIFPMDRTLVRFEQGNNAALSIFIVNHQNTFQEMYKQIAKHTRNYDQYLEQLISTFNDECTAWANSTFNSDFSVLIDPKFRYQDVLHNDV
jgi:CO dehydrogenase maturation factor